MVQRRAWRTCRKLFCARTVGLVAAFKFEMLKLYLIVAVLPVSSNACDSFFFFFLLRVVLGTVYFRKDIWCQSIHAMLWMHSVLNFLCSSEIIFPT